MMLVDPSENYDTHLRAYQKIAKDIPVNETYSKVVFGRVQNTSSPLTLITKEQKDMRDLELAETRQVASNAGKDAEERQAALIAQEASRRAELHDSVLDDKNAMINKIRKAAGQEVHKETETEKSETSLREKLSKVEKTKTVSAKKKSEAKEAEAKKSKEELLDDKNKLTEDIKKQSDEIEKNQTEKIK